MEERPKRIDNLTAGFMITTAVFFDLVSLIPIVNIISTPIGYFIIFWWFYNKKVKLFNLKGTIWALVTGTIEFIPAVSILPSITVYTIRTIMMVKSEDGLGIKIPSLGLKPK